MIRIKFVEPQTRVWTRWISDCAKAALTLKGISWWTTAFEIEDVYRRPSIKEMYRVEDGLFRGRCAYCEAYVTDFQHGDIEHFRPKKLVTDESDNPILIVAPDGKQYPHPGYYWLAYNWRNLLLSCIKCNQPGDHNIGKRNRFPIAAGSHAVPEEDVANEQPLLINPIDPNDEDPESLLGIDLETGTLTYPNSPRGEKCVAIFGLNIRDQLVQERRGALDEVKSLMTQVMYASDKGAQDATDRLNRMEAGEFSYTLARRALRKELRRRMGW